MLSILIPNFNDSCQDLVHRLVEEIHTINFEVEIIIGDDASTLEAVIESYTQFDALENVRIIKNKSNLGREKTRINLAKNAQFNWLLFLDADVLPKGKNFIQKYIEAFSESKKLDVIFGGIVYQEKPTNPAVLLRWKYGKANEEQGLSSRRKNQYRSLVTGAICIQKEVFMNNSIYLDHIYGLDILLAYQLKKANARVVHIENPVFHLGLETNSAFLHKTKDAMKSIVILEKKGLISADFRPIQRVYHKLEKLGLAGLCKWFFGVLDSILTKSISGISPKLFYFNLYRMLYFCHLKQSKLH